MADDQSSDKILTAGFPTQPLESVTMQTVDSDADNVDVIHSSVVYSPAIVKAEFLNNSSSRCKLPSGADFLPAGSMVGHDYEE